MMSRIVMVVFAGPGALNSVREKTPLASGLNVWADWLPAKGGAIPANKTSIPSHRFGLANMTLLRPASFLSARPIPRK
jgi:hypothetical protein